jgi:hypothetical protein
MGTASPQLDGRLDGVYTTAALTAQFPPAVTPIGTIATTSDNGKVWNSGSAWVPMYQAANSNGFQSTPVYRWRPTGKRAVVFSGTPAAGDTSETLNANWAGATGLVPLTLSTGQVVTAQLINGAETCPFFSNPLPASGGSYGSPQALTSAPTINASVSGQPPLLGVANAYSVSASIAASGSAVLGGAQTTSGVGTPDVPRNVVGAWTTSSTVTVTGTDYYGNAQTEAQTGTAFTGKKAFASITSIVSSAAITAATFGTGNVLGLPFKVNSGDISEVMFNDAADAGTFVPADLTMPATSSTGDVRGTYTAAGMLNGAKFLSALLKVADITTQVGTLGVTPA